VRRGFAPALDLPGAAAHCGGGQASYGGDDSVRQRGAIALNRAIFGLFALLLLNTAARAGGPAELNQYDVPAEARWAPFSANMPTCDDGGVLSTISGRFGQTQREFWNSQLAISGFDRVREIGFRASGLAYIPRRYCIARVAMSDSKERTVIYNVGSDFGIMGMTWGVEWCVVGLDPNFAYAPACSTLRPVIEREIGHYKWLGEYGLNARN
jgi:hypothetical protein